MIKRNDDKKEKLINLFIKSAKKAEELNLPPVNIYVQENSNSDSKTSLCGVTLNAYNSYDIYFIGFCIENHFMYFVINHSKGGNGIKCQLNKEEWENIAKDKFFKVYMNYKINDALKGTPIKQ